MSQDTGSQTASENPFSQAGITFLIIGLTTQFIADPSWRTAISMLAPFLSYGGLHFYKKRQGRQEMERACQALDNRIARLRAANQDPSTPAAEIEGNQLEIIRLNQLRTDTELKHYKL